MKKYFKFFGIALLTTSLCFATASCTKDNGDDDSTTQNGNNNGNNNGNGNGGGGQVQNGTVIVSLNGQDWTVGNGALIWNYVDDQQLHNSNYDETGKRIIMRGYSQKLTDSTFSYPGFQIWVSRSEHLIARPNYETNYYEANEYTLTDQNTGQQYDVGDLTYSNDTIFKLAYRIEITSINASTAQISFVDSCLLFDVNEAYNNQSLQKALMVINGQNVNYTGVPSKSRESFAVKNESATMVENKKLQR